jgi:hypothetical protein
MKKLVAILCAALAPCVAQADSIIFSDNFNSSIGGGNVTPTGWAVTAGTVDVVYPGWYNELCAAGGDRCVDLDGSNGQGGTLVKSLNLNSGVTYIASFDLAGNQRGAGPDNLILGFGSSAQSFALASNAPWARYSITFNPTASGAYTLSFQNGGGDNMGAMLDNVSVAAVPEPETYALMLAGLGLLGFMARRRKSA